jgi:hypothetical protein
VPEAFLWAWRKRDSFDAGPGGPGLALPDRHVPGRAARHGAPAVVAAVGTRTAASCLRQPGDRELRAVRLDVLRVGAGRVAAVTTFDPRLFPVFRLPATV